MDEIFGFKCAPIDSGFFIPRIDWTICNEISGPNDVLCMANDGRSILAYSDYMEHFR